MKKTTYETPQAELIEVNIEGNFCLSGNPTSNTTFDEQADINDQSGASWWSN